MMLQSRAAALAVGFVAAALAGVPLAKAEETNAVPAALEPGGSARVAKAIDGDTLELADGRGLRLVGIEAPKPPLDAVPDEPTGRRRWPLAEAARAALDEI